jgi:hypothetical protein
MLINGMVSRLYMSNRAYDLESATQAIESRRTDRTLPANVTFWCRELARTIQTLTGRNVERTYRCLEHLVSEANNLYLGFQGQNYGGIVVADTSRAVNRCRLIQVHAANPGTIFDDINARNWAQLWQGVECGC